MRKHLAKAAYWLGVVIFVPLAVELLLRLIAVDPFYYWQYRFQFMSPNVLQNRGEGVWTYRPHSAIREVAVYGLPSGFSKQPRLTVEFDCRMRSNNLGLLGDDDVLPGTPVTLVLGDSFTTGQGGCPWFPRLQARRPQDKLLNAGLIGTGVDQWWRLLDLLRKQGVRIDRVLIVGISNDFKRKAWNWTDADLDCINNGNCVIEGSYAWQGVRADETQDELIARTRERYAKRYGHYSIWSFGGLHLEHHSMFLKFVHTAIDNVAAMLKAARAGPPANTDAALGAFKALGVPVKVLMVNQRNEVGALGNEADAKAAEAMLAKHGLPFTWCRLNETDYLAIDGHPTSAGYDKVVACADQALDGLEGRRAGGD